MYCHHERAMIIGCIRVLLHKVLKYQFYLRSLEEVKHKVMDPAPQTTSCGRETIPSSPKQVSNGRREGGIFRFNIAQMGKNVSIEKVVYAMVHLKKDTVILIRRNH